MRRLSWRHRIYVCIYVGVGTAIALAFVGFICARFVAQAIELVQSF